MKACETKRNRTQILFADGEYARARQCAAAQGLSLGELTRRALAEFIAREDQSRT